ncbi:hypothetical protein E2C01_010957 [Portunus trituberculatus]|uniref:Uncharacterized protein n=1 Tax=Portunus trituberculatus TaxID=210409 RepID=A0A5B7DA42_PORTR|nr:hypothetical protein [Portunus trituberculatus]
MTSAAAARHRASRSGPRLAGRRPGTCGFGRATCGSRSLLLLLLLLLPPPSPRATKRAVRWLRRLSFVPFLARTNVLNRVIIQQPFSTGKTSKS